MKVPPWSTGADLFSTGRFLRRLTAVILASTFFHSKYVLSSQYTRVHLMLHWLK